MRPGPPRFLLAIALMVLGPLPARGQEDVLRVIAMPTPEELRDVGRPDGLEIDDQLLATWRRLVQRAREEGATILVLEITTPGGYLSTTKLWIQDLEDLQRQGIRTVAFVPHDATSAGAIIAVACRELVMIAGATIGNAIPLEFRDTGGFARAGEKLMTQVLGDLSRIAVRTSFNELLLHGMADPDLEVVLVTGAGEPRLWRADDFLRNFPRTRPEVRSRVVKARGTALKLTSGGNLEELRSFFPYEQVRSRDDLPRVLGLGDRPLRSEELLQIPAPSAGFLPRIFGGFDLSVLLLVLGILFFILELKTPGLGIFGVLGILALVGYFVLNGGAGPPIAFTLGLLILGFFLLLVELLFIPGFGVAGVSGILLILFSIYAATVGLEGETLAEQIIPDSPADWGKVRSWVIVFLGSLVFGTSGALFIARHLHRFPFLEKAFVEPPYLRPPEGRPGSEAALGAVTASGFIKIPLGAYGTADTDLRPAGRVRFAQGIVDVVTQGDWVSRGTTVRVVHLEGNRVVVSPATAEP